MTEAGVLWKFTYRIWLADSMHELRTILKDLLVPSWVAFRSFLSTVLIWGSFGVLLGIISYAIVRDYPTFGFFLGALVFLESIVFGMVLGGKRLVVVAMTEVVDRLQLGVALVQLLVQRLLYQASHRNPDQTAPPGEQIQFTDAVALLDEAVASFAAFSEEPSSVITEPDSDFPAETQKPFLLDDETSESSVIERIRRNVLQELLDAVREAAVACFRDTQTTEGMVNLRKVGSVLEKTVKDLVNREFKQRLNVWVLSLGLGLVVLVLLQAWLIMALVQNA